MRRGSASAAGDERVTLLAHSSPSSAPGRAVATSPAIKTSAHAALPEPPPAIEQIATEPASEPLIEFERPYAIDAPPRPEDPEAAATYDQTLAKWNRASAELDLTVPRNRYHPGTRVEVDARPLRKRVLAKTSKRNKVMTEQSLVAEARRRGYWPFRKCFDDVAREKSDPGGESRVRVSINTRGHLSRARLVKTEVADKSITECLVRAANKLRFSPGPPRRVDVELSIGIWPGDSPLPAATDPAPIINEVPSFNPEAFLQAVEAVRPAAVRCYAEGRKRNPDLWGRLALRIVLEIEGTIHVMHEHDSQFPDPEVVRCVEEALVPIVFPSVQRRPFTFVFAIRFGQLD